MLSCKIVSFIFKFLGESKISEFYFFLNIYGTLYVNGKQLNKDLHKVPRTMLFAFFEIKKK